MVARSRARRIGALVSVAASLVILAACNSSGGSSSSPTTTPTATPTNVTLSLTTLLPAIGVYQASFSFASAPIPAGVTVVVSGSTTAPSGVPGPPAGSKPTPPSSGATVVAAWSIVPAATATLTTAATSVSVIGLPTPPAVGSNYYTYFADAAGTSAGYSGPLVYNSTTLIYSLTASAITLGTLTAGHTYVFEIVSW